MITLQEVLDNLTYGDLSHISIGGADLGFIADKDFPKIVSCINNALTALHKRFLLKTDELKLQLYSDITTYYLRTAYAVSDTTNPGNTKYIIDSLADPFTGNLFKVESILNTNGQSLTFNDPSISEDNPIYVNGDIIQSTPIYIPNYDTIILTPSSTLELLTIRYRADHPKIVITTDFNPSTVELHIPPSIIDALSLNVAARLYNPLTSGDGERSAASAYMYQYEMECKRLEQENMILEDNTFDTRFNDNGFV